MRQPSIIRHALMALCAYLAVGVVLAQSDEPAVSLGQAQHGAVQGPTDCQAVMALAHQITRYWGAEEVARQLIALSQSAQELVSAVVGE